MFYVIFEETFVISLIIIFIENIAYKYFEKQIKNKISRLQNLKISLSL